MRISDWSSDVCSSDLRNARLFRRGLCLKRALSLYTMRPSLHHADVIIGSLPLPSLDGWRGRAVALALGLVSATGFQPLNLWPLTLAVIALFMMMAYAAQSRWRTEEHTSELQSLMRKSYAFFS